MTENPQYNRATCYFCLSEEREVLEEHHVVPRRFDGSDDDENVVRVCPTCHQKLERLYDKRFYSELGIEQTTDSDNDDDTATIPVDDDGRTLTDLIRKIERGTEHGAEVTEVCDRAEQIFGLSPSETTLAIESLKEDGEVYETTLDHIRATL